MATSSPDAGKATLSPGSRHSTETKPMAVIPESVGSTVSAVVEFKAAAFTLPIVRLLGTDMDAVAEYMGTKVDQAPEFFRNTPVVIDLASLSPSADTVPFPQLVGLLRGYGMIPVGVRGGYPPQNQAAAAMELAIMGEAVTRSSRQITTEQTTPEATKPSTRETFKLVTHPIRSGQRVHAVEGDLSIVGPVSSGAELMADGNIHVYGPLRGRAMAGMNGNGKTRIFCQALDAELISVAGHYRVSERIPATFKGIPVQIFLDQEVLRIEKL